MCPVYKFTRAETASPKAKANVLRALISGQIDGSTLFASRLQDVMLRCVSCGSCFRECPSNVNIPKMALEARARYIRQFGPSVNDVLCGCYRPGEATSSSSTSSCKRSTIASR